MAIQLNHTIVHAKDAQASAQFLTEMLGLGEPVRFGPFWTVQLDNGVTLDYIQTDEPFIIEHYAFLVSEGEFDAIFGRIQKRKLKYWADPGMKQEGEINKHYGGRGVYFQDLSGHLLEIITRPYGAWDG